MTNPFSGLADKLKQKTQQGQEIKPLTEEDITSIQRQRVPMPSEVRQEVEDAIKTEELSQEGTTQR